MSEQKSQDCIAQLSKQPHSSNSPQQQVVKLDEQGKIDRSSEHTFENLAISSNNNPSKIHLQANERELESPDEKHSFEEDVQSCWSDSATSNCDHNISSPTNYSSNIVAPNNAADATRERKFANKVRSSSNGRSSRCNTNSTGGRNVRKRVMANERERERTKSLNQALEILRDRLPVPEAEKRSKIQTLRMAKDYIEFLDIYMRSSSQLPPSHQTTADLGNPTRTECTQLFQYNQQFSSSKVQQLNTNSSQLSATQGNQPDSPLTYKFYKFRLKSQNKND